MKKVFSALIAAAWICFIPVIAGDFIRIDDRVPQKDTTEGAYRLEEIYFGRPQIDFIGLNRSKSYSLPDRTLAEGPPDTIKIIALRVDFVEDDDPLTTGTGKFDLRDTATFINEEGHGWDPAPHNRHYFETHLRAMAHYWEFVSRGKLAFQWEVWPQDENAAYHLDTTMAYYGAQAPAYGLGALFHDAINTAFGTDSLWYKDTLTGDKKAVFIFHAGADQQTNLGYLGIGEDTPYDLYTGFATFLGENRVFLRSFDTTVSGVPTVMYRDTVVEGTIMPETQSQDNRVSVLNAVMAHEFGHQLGLIDIYNTRSAFTQVGDFALMDNNGMNSATESGAYSARAFGTVPLFPLAWSRAYLGFDEVHEFEPGTTVELAAVKMDSDDIRIAKIPISATEYYLIENRRTNLDSYISDLGLRLDSTSNVVLWPAIVHPDSTSPMFVPEYDFNLPLGAGGLAVWHVDEMVATLDYNPYDAFDNNFEANTLQWDQNRRFISLVEADGIIDFGGNYYAGYGTKEDLFYSDNNTSLNNFTNPAAISNDGGYTHISISEVSAPDKTMSFKIDLPSGQIQKKFARRLSMPTDADISPVAVDLDGDGAQEIIAVSGRRILAVDGEGRDYLDPDALWDDIDTIFSPIYYETASNPDLGRLYDTASMPVFAETESDLSLPPVVARFNDSLVVLAGGADGRVYVYLPEANDTPDTPDRYRAVELWSRAPIGGLDTVIAVIADTLSERIITYHKGGWMYSSDWRDGTLDVGYINFGFDLIGVAQCSDGVLVLALNGLDARLYRSVHADADTILVDSLDVPGGFLLYPPQVTDFDRDGSEEVVMVSRNGVVYCYTVEEDSFSEYDPLHGIQTGDICPAMPVMADYDGDGFADLLIPGTNTIYGYAHNGLELLDFPVTVDRGHPDQIIITSPVVSDIDGDLDPELVVTTFDSIVLEQPITLLRMIDPDSIEQVDTAYTFYNYYSRTYALTFNDYRIDGFPVPAGIYGIRFAEDTVMGGGVPVHVKLSNTEGVLATCGGDGWLYGWQCGWSDNGARYPMAGRTAFGGNYLPLDDLGSEAVMAEFLPEERFFNYPNPASGSITTIRWYNNEDAEVDITIYDPVGDIVWQQHNISAAGNQDHEIDWSLAGVASGIYHCRLEARSGSHEAVAFKTIAVIN